MEKITTNWIKRNFIYLNETYFNGELPTDSVNFKVTRAKRYAGMVQVPRYNFIKQYTLNMSNFFNFSEKEEIDILLHEMIHIYIHFHDIKDNNNHGIEFRKIMRQLNQIGGFNITTTQNVEHVDVSKGNNTISNLICFYSTKYKSKVGIKVSNKLFYMIDKNDKEYLVERFSLNNIEDIKLVSTKEKNVVMLDKNNKIHGTIKLFKLNETLYNSIMEKSIIVR